MLVISDANFSRLKNRPPEAVLAVHKIHQVFTAETPIKIQKFT
jgi:hypothetical protein